MSERNCSLAVKAMTSIEAHEKHCAKREEDIDEIIKRIFDILDSLRNRWLAAACAIILVEQGVIIYLLEKYVF